MGRRATKSPPRVSLAERYRRHREAFELGLELGITPKEAEAELDRRAARESWKAAQAKLAAKRNTTLNPAHHEWSAPWMMRD